MSKGRGGALLREKIVASASRRRVIVVDASKRVDRLGTLHPVPVEVEHDMNHCRIAACRRARATRLGMRRSSLSGRQSVMPHSRTYRSIACGARAV